MAKLKEVKGFENLQPEEFEVKTRKPKILLFDIETAPNLSLIWGHYEQNALHHVRERYMLAWCAKWLDGKVISRCLPDYEGYDPKDPDDLGLVTELWKLFDDADVLIGHNLDAFDVKMSNARFIRHGLKPPQPYKTIDTKKAAKREFRFNSNKLNDLGKFLGVGRKLKHTGIDLWLDCLDGDPKAWNLMRRYNRQDVLLLERVYKVLAPYITNHPNIAILRNADYGCRNCGGKHLQSRGHLLTATGKRQRYQCQDCGAWMSGQHQPMVTIR